MAEDKALWVLTFRLSGLQCAIRVECVREVVPIAATTKAPGQPDIVEGFLNLRGATLSIVRLARLFDLPFNTAAWSPIILIENRGSVVGLLVDGVEDVLPIDEADLHPASSGQSTNECAEAEFSVEGRDYVLFDCDRLLLAEERSRIAYLQAQVQQRLADLGAGRP